MSRAATLSPSYRRGVAWIAENDEPDSLDLDDVAGFISTLLLADLWGKDPEVVAEDVVRYRVRRDAEERS